MLVKIFFPLLFCFSVAAASLSHVEGEGRFYSNDGDSIAFVKKQLLYQAYRDIFSKELQAMNLDHELFWKKYDGKFEEYFNPIHEGLKTKYKISKNYKGNNPSFEVALRRKRLVLKSKFGRLNRAIRSYSEKKMSRSTQMPNSRYINVTAKVSRKVLNNIYYSFISERKNRNFESLLLDVKFTLSGANWSELGVEVESDFTTVVKEHWRRWLQDNFKSHVTEIVVVETAQSEVIRSFLKIPRVTTHAIEEVVLSEDDEDSLKNELFGQFENALLLSINVKIKKTGDDKLTKEITFDFDGDFLLLDMVERKILGHHDFGKTEHTYNSQDEHTLSSNIASFIYRIPLTKLSALPRKLSRVPDRNGLVTITINNIKNINTLWKFNDFLTTKGAIYQFDTKIEQYNGSTCKLKLSYRGKTDDVLNIIRNLSGKLITKDLGIYFLDLDDPLSIDLLNPISEKRKVPVESSKIKNVRTKKGVIKVENKSLPKGAL